MAAGVVLRPPELPARPLVILQALLCQRLLVAQVATRRGARRCWPSKPASPASPTAQRHRAGRDGAMSPQARCLSRLAAVWLLR